MCKQNEVKELFHFPSASRCSKVSRKAGFSSGYLGRQTQSYQMTLQFLLLSSPFYCWTEPHVAWDIPGSACVTCPSCVLVWEVEKSCVRIALQHLKHQCVINNIFPLQIKNTAPYQLLGIKLTLSQPKPEYLNILIYSG